MAICIMDKLKFLRRGAYEYTGRLDETIRFIERIQLKDAGLWKIFVDQFRGTPDDHDNGWRCEYWGKMMRGGCFTYAYTQDAELYDILTDTVRDLLTAQDGLGRFSTYSPENEFTGWDIWGRKYIMLGLQYYSEICADDALKAEILTALRRHADYIMSKIGDGVGKKPINEATCNWYGLNSSSILEPFVRLYNMTGDGRYLDFSTYIVNGGGTSIANVFELAYEDKISPYQYPVTKAYEMMSCFEGLLEYYRVTGIEKWRTAVVRFTDAVMRSDITVIGCAGCTHELFDHSSVKQYGTLYSGIMQETCVTVTWMKLCCQVLRLTGDSKYADCIETSVYNALLGSVNTENSDILGGLPFDSYSPLRLNTRALATGGKKDIQGDRFYGCCAAIGSAGTGLIALSSVMEADDGVAFNLYIPGEIVTDYGRFSVATKYPTDGVIDIMVDANAEFTLYLRIPSWAISSSLSTGDRCEAGSYTAVRRRWKKGDTLRLELDMRTKLIHAGEIEGDPQAVNHISLRRGPVVLARDARLGDDNLAQPVNIACGGDGFVDVECKDGVYAVPLKNGSFIHMIGYAEAGKTWDKRSLMACWLPSAPQS